MPEWLTWQLVKKAAPYLLIAAAIGYVLMLRHDLGNARDKIASYQQVATVLEAPANDPKTMLETAKARMDESHNRKETLDRISREAKDAEQRSRTADAELNRAQQENTRKFSAAQRQIEDLQKRQSTGNLAADCAQISEDTKAPWKGWK